MNLPVYSGLCLVFTASALPQLFRENPSNSRGIESSLEGPLRAGRPNKGERLDAGEAVTFCFEYAGTKYVSQPPIAYQPAHLCRWRFRRELSLSVFPTKYRDMLSRLVARRVVQAQCMYFSLKFGSFYLHMSFYSAGWRQSRLQINCRSTGTSH